MGLSMSRKGPGLRRFGSLAATALVGGLLLGAAPASARDGFGDGFENELGRIAAREVVRFGKFVFAGGQGPYYFAQWGAAYPAPGYEAAPVPPPRYRRPAAYRGPAWRPYRPVATPPVPVYRPVPVYEQHTERCDHPAASAPYEEHIVYERYERTINRQPVPDPDDRYVRY